MEITKNNFNQQLPIITSIIEKSCFIGYDAEFAGILSSDSFTSKLFHTNKERYNNIRKEISKMVIIQVGLTMFEYNRKKDEYVAHSYTFHLCPQSFADIDQSFLMQASGMKFLRRHNFDLNKFLHEGIPYLNKAEEQNIRQLLTEKIMFNNLTRKLDMEDERLVQQWCSKVSIWLSNNDEDTLFLDVDDPILRYIVHMEVRNRFPTVLTTDSLGYSNKILIYRNNDVEGARSTPEDQLEEKLLDHLLGFSKIVKVLEESKKPFVGHNLYFDLLLFHNQFIGPLPVKYSQFKNNVNFVLPIIFDSKHVSHEMKNKLSFDEVWKSNILQDLYEFFSQARCKKLETGLNTIRAVVPFKTSQTYHEAGWDSYCSGYCLIRLGHWSAAENIGIFRPVSPSELLAALAPYCNKINVIRGAINHMNLRGEDPPIQRPKLLHIKSLKEKTININKVASMLSNIGSYDIKPHGRRTALIAASTHTSVKHVLKHFSNSEEYRVSQYSMYKHTYTGRMLTWGGALLTSSIVLYVLHRKFQK